MKCSRAMLSEPKRSILQFYWNVHYHVKAVFSMSAQLIFDSSFICVGNFRSSKNTPGFCMKTWQRCVAKYLTSNNYNSGRQDFGPSYKQSAEDNNEWGILLDLQNKIISDLLTGYSNFLLITGGDTSEGYIELHPID